MKRDFKAHGMSIEGLDEVLENLTDVLPREAKNLARSTVHGIAGKVRTSMRQKAPRRKGTLRKAIVAVRRRGAQTQVASDVWINHGKGQKHDAWYWHFVEWGTQDQPAQPYINPTVEEITPKIPAIYRDEFGKRLEKLMARKASKALK